MRLYLGFKLSSSISCDVGLIKNRKSKSILNGLGFNGFYVKCK